MSPRPYRLGQREAIAEQTRVRILAAARTLLAAPDGISGFSIDAVARQADVARMTVYHQFGSKVGLLEALCDALASSGGMEQLAVAFQRPDVRETLDEYIATFSHFWETDRLATRRLRALAALDVDFEQVIQAREQRRRHGVKVIVERCAQQYGFPTAEMADETADVLFALISFEYFDVLAGSARSIEEAAPVVKRLARAALRLGEE